MTQDVDMGGPSKAQMKANMTTDERELKRQEILAKREARNRERAEKR
jgi:hypothetical protein